MITTASDLPTNAFGGVDVLGVCVRSLDGTHVSVSGASLDGCHFGGELPTIKDRRGDAKKTAFLAVLGPSPERRAVMDDQTLCDQNPYVVAVTPMRCEVEGEIYVPDSAVPEDATFLVALIAHDTSNVGYIDGDVMTVAHVEPR